MKDAGKAQCLPSASQKNVLLGMRWAPKHGNHVTHKELRAASTFLLPLYRYKPMSLNNKPILQMPQGKRKVFLLTHKVDVRAMVLLSCSTALPARVRIQFYRLMLHKDMGYTVFPMRGSGSYPSFPR